MSRAAAVLLLFAWAGATSADAPAWSEVQRHDKAVLLTDRNPNAPWKVKLSESLTLLMRIEGAGPLDVEMAKVPRPTEGWQLEAVGEPKVTTGRESPLPAHERRSTPINRPHEESSTSTGNEGRA